MAHIDDLTLINAAQLLSTDQVYVGRPGDPDPDRRAALSALGSFIVGAGGTGLEARIADLEALGLRRAAPKPFAATNPATIHFYDADIPREGLALVYIAGDSDGGAIMTFYRRGSYNRTTGFGFGKSKEFGSISDPGSGEYRFWVDGQTVGARLTVQARNTLARTVHILVFGP